MSSQQSWGPSADQQQALQHQNEEILNGLKLFIPPGQVTELRALDVSTPAYRRPHTESGYFNDLEAMANAAMQLSPNAKGTYFIFNPVNPALLARSWNRIQPVNRQPLTSDSDVTALRWLPVDLDAIRPSGISSSDAEHRAAIDLAHDVANTLCNLGWPEPIVASSGNGAHLDYPIELPVTESDIVAGTLKWLHQEFSTDAVKIDTSVANPARIWKVLGTKARKGDSIPERPHRTARLLSCPTDLIAVPRQLLELAAASVSTSLPAPTQPVRNLPVRNLTTTPKLNSPGSLDLGAWLEKHGLDVTGPSDWKGGQRWVFNTCPWDDCHTDHSAYLIQFENGAIAAGCHHEGCADQNWHSLRAMIEPERQSGNPSPCDGIIPENVPTTIQRAFKRRFGSGQNRRGGK